jgi:cytochrome c peroxidase
MLSARTKTFLGITVCSLLMAAGSQPTHSVQLDVPKNWPPLVYDLSRNPLTQEGIELGRKLFHDPILSKDSTTSCSSCHSSYTAFSHVDHKLSHGIHDSIGTRNASALMNLAWSRSFMWDGAVNHLDMQPLAPINHTGEMAESTQHVVFKLENSRTYRRMFAEAFGDSMIFSDRMLKALAQFQLSLISAGSRYDRMKAGVELFTEQEQNGYLIFQAHCNACHKEPLFTTGEFANNGLPPDNLLRDGGRTRITHDPKDSLCFKIPTLRNVEFSFPYMHDGRFKTLRQVLDHYDHGIMKSATLAPELRAGVPLTSDQRTDLVAFLLTLSDREFVMDPAHAHPR